MKRKLFLTIATFPLAFLGLVAQNSCTTASPVTAGLYTVVAVDGTEIPTPVCAPNGTGASAGEWYVYTPSDDYTVRVSADLPQNTGKDTRLHIYTGTCGALTCHAGDDDSGEGYLSVSVFNVYQGTTYYIAFDNRWNSSGFDFTLEELPIVEPPNYPVTFTGNFFPAVSGEYKIAVADMNGDYLDDIVTVSAGQVQIHYQQTSGAYTNQTYAVNITYLPSWSMAIGDIDKNGFNDLVLGAGSGVTFLYANSTGTGFSEVTGSEYVFSQRTNFVDINSDGHLDAFVCHDVDPNVYYINDGNGVLTYHQGGLGDHSEGGNYGSVWVDYDNDGDADLFIAKCRGGGSTAKFNELHRNDGNGVFTNVSTEANMYDPVQTWSSAWNDYNNDGYMDALIGASSFTDGSHKLMRNNGDGTFTDITSGSGWDANAQSNIEYITFDFDNDGYADVMGGDRTISFNNGDLTFTGMQYDFYVGSVGDLNNDGFLDVQNDNQIYMNDGNDNNWLKIHLKGIASNINGIGARVELYSGGMKQIRDVRSGEGFRHMHSLNVHFGIGAATTIDSVIVRWPSGTIDNILTPSVNQSVLVIEGTHPLGLLVIEGKKVELYPNPASEQLSIKNLEVEQIASMRIVDAQGKEVMILDKPKATVNISSIQNGMYMLQIELKNGKRYSDSFIKK